MRGGFNVPLNSGSRLKIIASVGLGLASVGLLIALRLPVRCWQSLTALFSLNFEGAASRPTPFDNLAGFFPAFPLLALLLWLLSAFTLVLSTSENLPAQPSISSRVYPALPKIFNRLRQSSILLTVGLLLLVLLVGWAQRAAQLLPDSTGQFPQPNYDEMVYYAGSALFAAGHPPYREFFTAHPPGVYLTFAALYKLLGLQAGGSTTFLAGRWFSLIQGLLTVAGAFLVAGRLWSVKSRSFAVGAAFLAGLLYALDGRASEIAVLENLSNLFAIFSLGCLLESEQASEKGRRFWLAGAGALAAATALSKLPGLALVFALLVYLLYRRNWRNLGWFGLGFAVATILIEGPFILLAGTGEVLRQQFFFQLLRPQEVREGLDQIGRIAGYPEAALTVFLGGIGFCRLAWYLVRQPDPTNARLLIPALWSAPLLFIFIFSKSYHNWYYLQWALPLALLAGGCWVGRNWSLYRLGLTGLLVLLALPLLFSEWQTERQVQSDRVYVPSAGFVRQTCPNEPCSGSAMLALDPGYPLMAGLTPSRLANGKYLIDGSGYLVYLNLDLDRNSLANLFGQVLGIKRDRAEAQAIFERPRGQALILSGLHPGGWAALDGKIALQGQLTPRSVEYVETVSGPATSIDYVRLYQVKNLSSLREWRFDNGLELLPFGLSTSFEGRANYDPLDPGGNLRLSSKEAATRVLDLRLIWRVTAIPAQQLKVFVHLIDEKGQVVSQRDLPPLGENTDTRQWRSGDSFQDVQSLPLPAGLAPGRYRVILGLYDQATNQRILIEGQDSINLGQLEIL